MREEGTVDFNFERKYGRPVSFLQFSEDVVRALVILVCGVLLSVQGFAVRGVAGKNSARQLKDLLHNQPLMKAVAAALGGTSVAINSRNLGEVLDSKQPIERSLASVLEDLGVDMKSVLSTMTKAVGEGADDGWSGDEDYIVRGIFVQGIPVTDSNLNPVLYIDGGYAHYGNKKRSADGTVGIGVGAEGVLFGNKMQLQLRGGFGILGEGQHDPVRDEFNEIDDGWSGDEDYVSSVTFVNGALVNAAWSPIAYGDDLSPADGRRVPFVGVARPRQLPFVSVARRLPFVGVAMLGRDGSVVLGQVVYIAGSGVLGRVMYIAGRADFDTVTHEADITINITGDPGVPLKYGGTKAQKMANRMLGSFSRYSDLRPRAR